MLTNPTPEASTGLSRYLIFSVAAFLLAGLYLGWVFYSRWQENQTYEEKAADRERSQERAQERQTYEMMGGSRFDILGFYADTPRIQAGESVDLCYSVSNAKSVKLEPQSQPVWPAFSRCVQVSPRKTTTYTFTAEDAAGHTKTATVKVEVR